MNLAHCETHDIKFNPNTTDTCPLCITLEIEPIERPSLGIRAKNRSEYNKEYKKLNYEKLKNYKTEWTRKKREEWRKKYGKIFY